MGLFDFLKKAFAEGKTELEKAKPSFSGEESISIQNLNSWLASKEEEKLKDAELASKEMLPRLQSSVKDCEKALKALKEAPPRYPLLYEQNKVLADGNKQTFITASEIFFKAMELPSSPNLLLDSIQKFDLAMSNFIKQSNRSFIITTEFFTDQAVQFKSALQTLDKRLLEIKTYYLKNKLSEFPKVKEKISKLVKKIQQSQEAEAKTKEDEAALLIQKQKLDQDKVSFTLSAGLKEWQKLDAELKDAQTHVKAKEAELYSLFSTLDTPLMKLAWENPDLNKRVSKYMNNLTTSVLEDIDFGFSEVLTKLRCAIEAGSIDLKDKKGSHAIKDINKVTYTFIHDWQNAYKVLKAKAIDIQSKLDKSEVTKQELELKNQSRRLEAKEEALNKMKSSFERKKHTDVDKELEETSNAISSLLGHHIKIQIG